LLVVFLNFTGTKEPRSVLEQRNSMPKVLEPHEVPTLDLKYLGTEY
jgi:hypothetical protein